MNVISHGHTYFHVACQFCKAKLECSDSDIGPKYVPDWLVGNDTGIVCLECGRWTPVSRRTRFNWKKLRYELI